VNIFFSAASILGRVKVEVKDPWLAREIERELGARTADIAEERLTNRTVANHLASIRLAKRFANVLVR
jgi:hypothetical protein